MLIKICGLVLVIAFASFTLSAQTSVKPASNESWEYLIVSISTFSDKENLAVSNKWIGRRQGNVGFYQDVQMQNEFDRLGKLGWELVEILPVNVNDQPSFANPKFIFKRKFDSARSEREAEDLKKLENEFKNISPNTVKATDLIELDQAEFKAKQNEVADRAKAKLEQAIKNTSITSVLNITTAYSDNIKQTYAEIVVDGSSALLEGGNKYRLSEAKKYARQIAVELFNKIGLRQLTPNEDFYNEYGNFSYRGEVTIKLSIVINYNGTIRNVAVGYINGNWAETIK